MDDQEWWVDAVKGAKTLSDIECVFRNLWPGLFPKPFRKTLFDFPDVVIHTGETAVKKHPLYGATKFRWEKRFVHTFDCLTQSEARYLLKTENADRIRNKIAEAEQERDR